MSMEKINEVMSRFGKEINLYSKISFIQDEKGTARINWVLTVDVRYDEETEEWVIEESKLMGNKEERYKKLSEVVERSLEIYKNTK